MLEFRRKWACSSMVEQWPFKPLVGGSIPSTLIEKNPSEMRGFLVLLWIAGAIPAQLLRFNPGFSYSLSIDYLQKITNQKSSKRIFRTCVIEVDTIH